MKMHRLLSSLQRRNIFRQIWVSEYKLILNLNKQTILIVIIHHSTLSPECRKNFSFMFCFHLL